VTGKLLGRVGTISAAMDDFASDTDSDYTSYWRDWVSDPMCRLVMMQLSRSSNLFWLELAAGWACKLGLMGRLNLRRMTQASI
jgi:hypothetical protein